MQLKRTPVGIFFLLAALSVVLAFQNCGQLNPSATAISSEIVRQQQYLKDLQTVGRVTSSSGLKVWASARDSAVVKASGAITSVSSLNADGYKLLPPLNPPTIVNGSSGAPMFSLPGNSTLQTQSPDFFPKDTKFSLVAVVDQPATGVILRLSSNGYQEALVIDAANNAIRARHYYSDTQFESLSFSLAGVSGPLVVAASFTDGLGTLTLQVNGHVATETIVNEGNIIASSAVFRQLNIGDFAGNVNVGEVMAMQGALEPWELNTMSRYIGDKWGVAVFNDHSLYPADGDDPSKNLLPTDVRTAIDTNCASCHVHEAWKGYSLRDFKTKSTSYGARLIVPGDYLNSELYQRIQNTDGQPKQGTKTMPQNLSITPADTATIKNWIQSLTP